MLDELGSFYFTNYYFGWGSAGSRNWAVWDGGESTALTKVWQPEREEIFLRKWRLFIPWFTSDPWTYQGGKYVEIQALEKKKKTQPLFPVRRNHLLILWLPRKAPLACFFVSSLWKGQWAFRWVKHLGVWDAAETVLWLHMSCDVTSPGAGRGEAEACCGELG